MRKYISALIVVAAFFSIAHAVIGADYSAEKISLSLPSTTVVFYKHADRPPEELDGPSIFDRKSFDRIFNGGDRFIGEARIDMNIYVDDKTGCFYSDNDHAKLYHLDLLGGGTDSFYGFTPAISWNSGDKTEGIPFSYAPAFFFGHCADIRARTKAFVKKLIFTGSIDGSGLRVYEPKAPLNSAELKKLYKSAVFPNGEKPSFETYVTKHPLIYVYDNLGSFHRLLNSNYMEAAEMGKPALYLYPEKETEFTVKVLPVGGKITKEIPVLKNLAWFGSAKPNGELKVDGKTYPYLYYESTTNQPMAITKGTVVARRDLPTTLSKMLDTLGFKTAEKQEFLAYWLPRMNSKPYYVIEFLINQDVDKYSQLSIKPALPVYRVFMNYKGYSKPVSIPAQKLQTLDRLAPHAFEWGGNNLAE